MSVWGQASGVSTWYSGHENHCNVWRFWTGCNAALDSVEISLSAGGVEQVILLGFLKVFYSSYYTKELHPDLEREV